MAMNTSTLLALLAIGFLMLFAGESWWWLGIAIIMGSLVLAVGRDTEPQKMPYEQAAATASSSLKQPPSKPASPKKGKKKGPTGSVKDPLHFRPSIPPDGIASIGSIKPGKGEAVPGDPGNVSVGKRTGTVSMYMDPPDLDNGARVRVKDDVRVHLPFMNIKDENGIRPFQNLFTSHFRTGKPILKTKALEPTFETWKTYFDKWAKEDDAAEAEKRKQLEERWKRQSMS